jgi:hypothetical protein
MHCTTKKKERKKKIETTRIRSSIQTVILVICTFNDLLLQYSKIAH